MSGNLLFQSGMYCLNELNVVNGKVKKVDVAVVAVSGK
jgi:copper chaperone CopZ